MLKKKVLALDFQSYFLEDKSTKVKAYSRICNYWNRVFCKSKRKCLWDRNCSKRHRQVCRYWLEEGCTRKKECQFLHTDVGTEYYTSSLSIGSPEREVSEEVSHYQTSKKSENEENKSIKVSGGSISD